MTIATTADQRIRKGLWFSIAIGLLCGVPIFAILIVFSFPLALFFMLVVGGIVAYQVIKRGFFQRTGPGTRSLATRNGAVTGEILDQGVQWGIPGLDGQIPVDIQENEFSPDVFKELVNDVPVEIDLLCMGDVTDLEKYFVVTNPEEKLAELVEAQARTFTSPWVSADSVTEKKNMLPEYLMLPPKGKNPPKEHNAFKKRLLKFTKVPAGSPPDTKADLTEEAVIGIMEKAGLLVTTALSWGITPRLAEIKRFDIPEELKELGVKVLIAAKQAEMVKELIAATIKPQDALNAVQMVLKLPITKTVDEFQIRDLDKVAESFGKLAVEVIARFVDNYRRT